MGFLGKLKGTAKQAVSPGQMMGQRETAMRINQVGVERPATVRSANKVGSAFGGDEYEFELEVEGADGTSYAATVRQAMHGSWTVAAGDRITVRVDPDDPQSMLIWGGAA